MQQEESKIMKAKVTFTERSLQVVSYILDGHLREIDEIDQQACSQYVQDQTGYRVTFTTKPQSSSSLTAPHPLSISSPSPCRGAIAVIYADGHCLLRAAGEIGALLRDPSYLLNNIATCPESHPAQARAETIFNFSKWLDEKRNSSLLNKTLKTMS